MEIETLNDFRDVIAKGDGLVVLTDKPTRRTRLHQPTCMSVQERFFVKKVIENKRDNGQYFWASTKELAVRMWGATPCAHCAP